MARRNAETMDDKDSLDCKPGDVARQLDRLLPAPPPDLSVYGRCEEVLDEIAAKKKGKKKRETRR